MIRIAFSLVVCLMLASEAQAVRLADGAAVGQMFGYAAACVKNINMDPPVTQEDKKVGESYVTWLKNNTQNPIRIFNEMQSNLGIGMATAARNNYSNCEGAILEMIGFYEFFKLKGASYYPVLAKYQKSQTPPNVSPSSQQETTAGEPPVGMFVLHNDFTKAIMKLSLNEGGDLMMTIKSTSTFGIECNFQGMCDVNGVVIECNQAFANSDKILTVSGQVVKGNVELFSISTDSVCSDGGVIDGVYKKSK